MLASEMTLVALLTGMAALDWTEIKAPSTARVTALTAVGKTLMAGTDKGTLFRSGDGGESWTKSSLPAGYPVLSFSAYGDTVRAMRSEYSYPTSDCFGYCPAPNYPRDVAESRNGGFDWSEFQLAGVTHMTRSSEGALWAVSRDSVFYRASGAQTWIRRRFAFPPDPLLPYPVGNCQGLAALPGSLYALLDNRIYRIDTGFSADTLRLTRIGTRLAYGLYADSLRVLLSFEDGVYRTTPREPSPLGSAPSLLGWMGRGETGILALSRHGDSLYRSLDHGATWIAAGPPRLPDSAVAVAEAGGVIAAAAGSAQGKLLFSAQAKEWKPAGNGLFESPVTPVLVHGGRIWALTHLGLVNAPLGGGEWMTETGPMIGSDYFGMAAAGGKIWAGSQYGLWFRDSASGNWTQVSRRPVTALAVSGERVAAAVGSDNGTSRQNLVTLCGGDGICLDSPGVMGVATYDSYYRFLRGRMDILAARGDTILASDTVLYRSRDGGRTWDTAYDWGHYRPSTMAWAGDGLFLIRYAPECPGCLLRSENLGASWEAVDSLRGPRQPTALLSDGNRLYLLAKTGLLSSLDGRHWSEEDATDWASRPSLAVSGGYLALGDGEGHLRIAPLLAAPSGIGPRSARARRGRPFGARMFPDRAGHPRLANGASPP